MYHILTKNETLLNRLNARLTRIDRIAERYNNGNISKEDHSPLYKEIGYFIHEISEQEESREIFQNLIHHSEKLNDNQDYNDAVDGYNNGIRHLAFKIKSLEHFGGFDALGNLFPNPYIFPPFLKASELLEALSKYDMRDRSEDRFVKAGSIALRGLLVQWIKEIGETDLESLVDDLEKLDKALSIINFYRIFENGYVGSPAAVNLQNIYVALNPIRSATEIFTSEGDTHRYTINEYIAKGLNFLAEHDQVENLRNDCHSVMNLLLDKLNNQLAIEIYIERFITYFSLYHKGKFPKKLAETTLQRDFEEFLFNAGYYPISQATVKSGRLDTIAVDRKFAFLVEFKQFDLGTTPESNVRLPSKLVGGQLQSAIYFESLQTYPGLNHNVFIILFTNRKVYFKNNKDRLKINSINFIFKSVTIYEKSASLAKEFMTVDIDLLFTLNP